MRKANKIMMITVSVLLSAVLLTTSALSGTLAKYTTSATAHSESARVAKWGVEIDASFDPNLEKLAKKDGNDDAVIVQLEGIKIRPGDSFPKAIHFTVSGQAEVKLRVTIKSNIGYNTGKSTSNRFVIPKNYPTNLNLSDGTLSVMPAGFYFGYQNEANGHVNKVSTKPWRFQAANNADNNMTNCINSNIIMSGKKTAGTTASDTCTGDNYSVVWKDFEPTEKIAFYPQEKDDVAEYAINDFYFGFEWPDEYSSSDLATDYQKYDPDDLTMYFESLYNTSATNDDPFLTFTFTITVEQIQ